MKENLNYSIVLSSDSSFTETKILNTKDLAPGATTFQDIRTILQRLKKGEKYRVHSINFVGDAYSLLPESYPSVEALYKLMKKNKKMVIRIEGHINGGSIERMDGWNLKLSENRAETVLKYLVNKGIEKERISTIGFSDKKMLYPRPKNEAEGAANRRVEINVLSID